MYIVFQNKIFCFNNEHKQFPSILCVEQTFQTFTAEKDTTQTLIAKLESELTEAKLKNAASDEILDLKQQSEDTLTRAKELLFEKTKICKNQELQIEALHQQIASLKDVVAITKDLLNIRNMETQHLQEKLDLMESKITTEKEKHQLIYAKLESMVKMNTDLKREYEAQLCLFNALREKYAERELARNVLDELRRDVANEAEGANAAAAAADNAVVAVDNAGAGVSESTTDGNDAGENGEEKPE